MKRMVISRRAILTGLVGNVLATRFLSAQTRILSKPKPLAKDAVTHDWTAFLGPTHNAISTETRLSRALPPPLIWEFAKGTGYVSPAIAGQRLLFLHRLAGEEIVECLHAETGARNWQFRYPTDFEDRYGYNNGPRSSPVIDGARAYTVGAQGQLHCLDVETGKVIWKRDLDKEYRVPQDFFGRGSTPLIEGPLLIVSVGAPGGPCVVGFDKTTGSEVWRAGKEWGAGYASPVPAVVHGQRRVLVFAGGESKPPAGGLMSIDPSNGRVDFAFPWRSRTYESVNASCPVVFDNKVFVSASYRAGGALVEILPDFSSQAAVDDAGVCAAFQHTHLQGWLSVRVRWTERARCLAGVRRCLQRQSRVAEDTRMGRSDRGRRSTPAAAGRDLSGIAAGRRWAIPGARRAWPPSLDGPHAEGIHGGVARLAVRGARVVDAARAEPRPAVRRAEHAGHRDRRRPAAGLLRPPRVSLTSIRSSS